MGGMQRAVVTLANSWANDGKKVDLILLFKLHHFFELNPSIKLAEPPEISNSYSKIRRLLFLIKYIKTRVKASQCASVLVFGRYYSALAVFALRNSNVKVIISDRASPLYRDNLFAHLITKFVFYFYKPDGVIAQTKIAAAFQQKFYGASVPIEVIPNALRPVRLYPEIKREKIILAVGRLGDALKGFDRLIDAFSRMKTSEWVLAIAGGDENGQYLKDQAKRLGILSRIQFLGQVKNIDLVYARAGIFVIPSRSEGFPNALCEAMAAGLPCISFDFVAGPADLIQNGLNGILVKDGDIDGLALSIENLINHPQLRSDIGNQAMKIRDHLHSDKIISSITNFILHV